MKSFHPDHLIDLRKSGLSDQTIEQAEIITVPHLEAKARIGFNVLGLSTMYEIPYPGCNGFSRFRCFYEDGKSGPKYLQRKNAGNHLYVPTMIESVMLNDPTKPLYFTEGEKKSLKACQEGLPCIGLSGLWSWKNKGSETLISDFDLINFKNRIIYLVPDDDWLQPNKHGYQKNLRQAVYMMAGKLIERGARVFIVNLAGGVEVK